jgi:hypothetical protein
VAGSTLVKGGKRGPEHPFAKKEPKPTRARLVSLLDPLGRKRYAEVERFLATINGATSGLHFYERDRSWGWAVRYMLGTRDSLCTLHLLPNLFEATVSVDSKMDSHANGANLPAELRRRIGRTRPLSGVRWVRLPIRSDSDYLSFQALIQLKATALRGKEGKGKSAKAKAL